MKTTLNETLLTDEERGRYWLEHLIRGCQAYGRTVADELFISQVNPRNCAAEWNWSAFPDFVARMAEASCWNGHSEEVWDIFKDRIRKTCSEAARLRGEEILKVSNVEAWWSKTSK